MKKQPPIHCGEIIPGAFYLAPRRDDKARGDCIAEVICSQEPGWQRGFVMVTPSLRPSTGSAMVRFLDDGVVAPVPIYLQDEDWVFATGPQKFDPTTLRPLPEDYFAKRFQQIEQDINELTLKIGQLEDLRSHLSVLQHKVSNA